MADQRFKRFKVRVSELLKTRHGITIEDCTDDARLRAAHAAGDKPEEFVDGIASKYYLDRIDQSPYGG
jgi:hypothetical protein